MKFIKSVEELNEFIKDKPFLVVKYELDYPIMLEVSEDGANCKVHTKQSIEEMRKLVDEWDHLDKLAGLRDSDGNYITRASGFSTKSVENYVQIQREYEKRFTQWQNK